ncbi:MAG: hypothetical protein WBS24_11725 [Terriglobales bacterium]
MSLETRETLFSVLAAINTCGYDQDLDSSDPLRSTIRAEVTKSIESTPGAKEIVTPMCVFYRKHLTIDAAHDLSQYVSLALCLDDPPDFAPRQKVSEMPPDAASLIEFASFVQEFYKAAGLHAIWERHKTRYTELTEIYHDPLSKMIFDTEIYLKLPSAGYLGRQFTIYLDAMGAPGQTNARNYGPDYYVVLSPASSMNIKMQQIRHTYLHYLLDPLAMKHDVEFARLHPLLERVKSSPMDEAFRANISLLVTECLIRAIELRTSGGKVTEADRAQALNEDDREGFILTRDFYNALAKFEQGSSGFRNAYGAMLDSIDVNKEMKRASQIQFADEASPELLHLARPKAEHLLLNAAQKLSAGDAEAAQKLAQQALDEKQEDAGMALFILAQVATANRDMEGARAYFQRAIEAANEPRVIAWSHIYLGRIFDLKEDRPAAIEEYRLALNAAGTALPEAKLAAQNGIEKAYEPRGARQPE